MQMHTPRPEPEPQPEPAPRPVAYISTVESDEDELLVFRGHSRDEVDAKVEEFQAWTD